MTVMSTQTFEGYGPIPFAPPLASDDTGWTNEGCMAEGPDSAGDYCLSRVFETRYEKYLPDGRILQIDVAYYVETVENEADEDGNFDPARMGVVERTHTAAYASHVEYDNSDPEIEDYEYEHVGYLFRDSIEAYEQEALDMAVQDLRWALCWDGSRLNR